MLRSSMEEYKKEFEEKAKNERNIEIARNMLKEGMELDISTKVTKLPEREIIKIEIE